MLTISVDGAPGRRGGADPSASHRRYADFQPRFGFGLGMGLVGLYFPTAPAHLMGHSNSGTDVVHCQTTRVTTGQLRLRPSHSYPQEKRVVETVGFSVQGNRDEVQHEKTDKRVHGLPWFHYLRLGGIGRNGKR